MPRQFGSCLLRLTDVERQQLNLVIAALKVSEYTDEVDDIRYRQRFQESRMVESMQDFFDTLVGLAVASDAVPKKMRDQFTKKPVISSYAPLLAQLFEVTRRHKQLNPSANRCEFGKLMMILQDVQKPSIQRTLNLDSPVVLPVKTVGGALAAIQRTEMLEDPEVERYLAQAGEKKAEALRNLIKKYDTNKSEEDRAVLERCLRSIDDVETLILSNIDPLLTLQNAIKQEFMTGSAGRQIAISSGRGGACLSHSHEQHCQYVMESLVLWELVQRKIFLLWSAAEKDMLMDGEGRYQFVNTGQGFQRMCSAPSSYSIMSQCVREAQERMGGQWIGIKVIHLGDRDVPNPLVFIDKYTQIPGLVYPVTQTLKQLKILFGKAIPDVSSAVREVEYPGISNLLREKYRSYEDLRLSILADFFKHAFDGSGDDGGSCIDGRLTSAWNWCQQLSKKMYYEAFMLSGFLGFG
eukprot:gene8188-5714_t